MTISSKNNIRKTARELALHERTASHLNESTKMALEHCILAVGGDDSVVYVLQERADKACAAMHLNFGHRKITSEDIAIYNPTEHAMTRLVRIPISAMESEQIKDAIGKKQIQGAATIVHGSPEENGHALMNELERRGAQRG